MMTTEGDSTKPVPDTSTNSGRKGIESIISAGQGDLKPQSVVPNTTVVSPAIVRKPKSVQMSPLQQVDLVKIKILENEKMKQFSGNTFPNSVFPQFPLNIYQNKNLLTKDSNQKAPFTIPPLQKNMGPPVNKPPPSINVPPQAKNVPFPVPNFSGSSYSTNTSSAIQPTASPVNIRNSFPHPAIKLPPALKHDVPAPEPFYFKDSETGSFGVRCVCGQPHIEGLLIQCDICGFWLHGLCVNIARETEKDSYLCPFCQGKKIRCKCGLTKDYNIPLVQCTQCRFWVHKSCENLDYGIIPTDFICSFCGEKIYTFPKVSLNPDVIGVQNDVVQIQIDRNEILQGIPDGSFKDMIIEDLNKGELSFCQTISKYFQEFTFYFFERASDFWKVFSQVFMLIFQCPRQQVFSAIDYLGFRLLYSINTNSQFAPITKLIHSESITEFLSNQTMPRIEKQPKNINLIQSEDGKVLSSAALDDGAYITDLPGFLMHFDEVKADQGIPNSCITITDMDISIDLAGSPMSIVSNIKRSFHFNCVLKLVKINGEIRVALYATRMSGPLGEERTRRGPAIPEKGELFLPFDGDIPFNIIKNDWKEKKARPKINKPRDPVVLSPPPVPIKTQNTKKKPKESKRIKNEEQKVDLTLLSGFLEDIIPPLPFLLFPDRESAERFQIQKSIKTRSRTTRTQNPTSYEEA